jgi:hypothetical protein
MYKTVNSVLMSFFEHLNEKKKVGCILPAGHCIKLCCKKFNDMECIPCSLI